MSVIYEFMQAFNAGDRASLDDLWADDAEFAGGRRLSDPEVTWIVDLAIDGLHEQIIGACHETEPEVVFCDELHLDDLIRPAGVGWRTSRVYALDSGQITGYTETSSNRTTVNDYYAALITWIARVDPGLFERAFDFGQDIVWRSIDAAHEVIALVDEFLAQSPDYPLVPPERLENAELTATVGDGVDVYNGEARQIELVEWGLERFDLAELDMPPVASVTFPPHELCSENSGWAIDDGEELRVVMCIYEVEMCADEGCETLSPVARVTFVHELAHVWTSSYTDTGTRQRFLDLRGLDSWQGPNLEWADQGTEQAADIVMWGLMDDPLDLFRLGIPACEELEEAFRLLTGTSPVHGDC